MATRGSGSRSGSARPTGDKYSGGLGTYTAKHVPLAIYAPAVNKTFFVYRRHHRRGRAAPAGHGSEYDHATHTVPRADDRPRQDRGAGDHCERPARQPRLAIDDAGHLWVFVSGRGTSRQDWLFKSTRPYSADGFQLVEPPGGDKRGYPQVFHIPGSGFIHLFTIYQPGRELFVRTSADGLTWSPKRQLADMEGHYQVSWRTRQQDRHHVQPPSRTQCRRAHRPVLHPDHRLRRDLDDGRRHRSPCR